MDIGSIAVSPDLLKAAPTAPQGGSTPEKIAKTSKDFESSFLSIMLGEMFKGVGGGEFSGGQGEEMFKTFLTDAMSKQIVRAGGIGISDTVQREMLKMQGLEQP